MKLKAASIILSSFLLCGFFAMSIPPKAEQHEFRSIPKRILQSSVRVEQEFGRGSGVILAPNYVLTNHHVVHNQVAGEVVRARSIKVRYLTELYKGDLTVEAEIIKADKTLDLALLKTGSNLGKPARLCSSDSTYIGSPTIVVGAPGGGHHTSATLGYLTAKESKFSTPFLWQSSNPIYFGNSGGGVYDANTKELIGITRSLIGKPYRGMAPNVCLFIPFKLVKDFLKGTDVSDI